MKKGIEFWTSEAGVYLIEGWSRSGLSNYVIGKKMGVSAKRLAELEVEYEVIGRALANRGESIEAAVERALVKKALAGDVRACCYWLNSRKVSENGGGCSGKDVDNGVADVDGEIEELLGQARKRRRL